jgi:2-isopropylmalate synthase
MSGIHQDGMLKNAGTYEIMTPESVGVAKTSLVMGKHSGRHAFKEKLKELGYELGENALEDAFTRFRDLADRRRSFTTKIWLPLVDDEIAHAYDRIKLVALTVIAGTKGPQSAALTLDIDGEQKTHQATGNGPVDAIFNAIPCARAAQGRAQRLFRCAVTQGTDAKPEVSVRLAGDGKSVTAKGADPDTLVASARAYIASLNKLMVKRGKQRPEVLTG